MFWLKGKGDFISVVCYATVEGPNAIENNAKYKILQDLVRNSGFFPLKDMQTPPPSEMTPPFF